MDLTLDQADRIATAVLARGREQSLDPLTVTVLDAGGHVKVVKRDDGSGFLRPDIALAKAWGALGMGKASGAMTAGAEERPAFFNALAAVSGGRLVPVAGGVLVRTADGLVIGAVGVSGDTSAADEGCAVDGIRTVGLSPDTGIT